MKPFLLLLVLTVTACAHEPGATSSSTSGQGNAREPLVVQNPDGTVTVQREAESKDKRGLVIKPQVVNPTVSPQDSEL